MYRRTLRFPRGNEIRIPSTPDIEFELFLPSPDPRWVVLFCDPNGSVTEQYRCPLDRHTGKQHLHREGIPESERFRFA